MKVSADRFAPFTLTGDALVLACHPDVIVKGGVVNDLVVKVRSRTARKRERN